MTSEISILKKNQEDIDKLIVKIYKTLSWVYLAYVIIRICMEFKKGISPLDMLFYGQVFVFWSVPIIYKNLRDKTKFKYYVIPITGFICAADYIARGQFAILICIIPLMLTGMYNETNFTKKVSVISAVALIITVVVRINVEKGFALDSTLSGLSLALKYVFQFVAISVISIITTSKYNSLIEESEDMKNKIGDILKKNVHASGEVSSDLTVLNDNISSMEQSTNEITASFHNIVDEVSGTVQHMEHLNVNVEKTRDEIDNIRNQIGSVIDNNENIIKYSNDNKNRLSHMVDVMEESCRIAGESSEAVKQLIYDSRDIENILESLKAVSKKTNILTLNASIEAARAGESGKGISVVANEMQKLTVDSEELVGNIGEIFEGILKQINTVGDRIEKNNRIVNDNVGLIRESIDSFDSMFKTQEAAMDSIDNTNSSIEKLYQYGNEVNNKVDNLREINNTNNDAINEIYSLIEEITESFGVISDRSEKINMKAVELGKV